jgi:two-component system sensor histidine kinase UhpB
MSRHQTEESNTVLRRQNQELEATAGRIGRALYEQTLQLLAVVHLELYRVERDLPLAARARFNRTRELLEEINTQLAGFSNDLRPRVLEDLGLVAAIEFLAQRFSKMGGIPIWVDSSMAEPVPPPIGMTLHRAIQEALTNVLRHSRATNAGIRIRERAGVITCAVQDDGVGFDVSEVLAARGERGLGLIGIRDSTRPSGGNVTIHSTPGQGTELLITLRRAGKPHPIDA